MASVPREGAVTNTTPSRSTVMSTNSVGMSETPRNIIPLEHNVYDPPVSDVVVSSIENAPCSAIVENLEVGGAPSSSVGINYANFGSSGLSREISGDRGIPSGRQTSGTDVDFSHVLRQNQIMVQQQAVELKAMKDMLRQMQQRTVSSNYGNDIASIPSRDSVCGESSASMDHESQSVFGCDGDLGGDIISELDCPTSELSDDDGLQGFEKIFSVDQGTGPDISAKIATIVNSSLSVKVTEDKRKDIMKKHMRPGNCQLLVPKVNKGVWRTLRKTSKETDVKWQNTQQMLCTSMYPLLKLTDFLYSANKDQAGLLKKDLVHALRLANDSVISMLVAFTDISQKRRLLLKPDMNKEFRELCHPDNPITDMLFGNDLDQKVKQLEEEAKVGKKMSKPVAKRPATHADRATSFYGGERPTPYYRPRQHISHTRQHQQHMASSTYSATGAASTHDQPYRNRQPFLGKSRPPRGKKFPQR